MSGYLCFSGTDLHCSFDLLIPDTNNITQQLYHNSAEYDVDAL